MHHKRGRPIAQRAGCWCKFGKKVGAHELRGGDQLKSAAMLRLREDADLADQLLGVVGRDPVKRRRKDTRRWCLGKEGREHVMVWVEDQYQASLNGFRNFKILSEDMRWEERCSHCGKKFRSCQVPYGHAREGGRWVRFRDPKWVCICGRHK